MSDTQDYIRQLVAGYHNRHFSEDKFDDITVQDVFIVWFSKTLQNWKALAAADTSDDYYYELTYDGDEERTYIDVYDKVDNTIVKD